MLTKRDWTLLVLSSAEGRPLTPVQLQKALFLFGQKMPDAIGGAYYHFVPYNYGPFDASIYTDAESLASQGLARIEQQPGRKWAEYSITPAGVKQATELKRTLSGPACTYLDVLVTWVRSLSFEDLLHAVYSEYPTYAANSVFKG